MASTLEFILRFFRLPELNKMIIQDEVRKANLGRCVILTGLAAPVSLLICLFNIKTPEALSTVASQWHSNLVTLNAYVFVIFLSLSCACWYLKIKKNYDALISVIMPHIVFIVMAGWGSMSSFYDQAISDSIIGFLLVCLLNAIGLLMRPAHHAAYLIVLYVCFYYGMIASQRNPDFLQFNLINGLCVIAVSIALSTIFWNNNMNRFKQNRVIKYQQLELISQYEKLVESTRELERSNASKDKFFSILAHDLRGPITSTLALTELLEEGMFEEDIQERQNLYKLLQNSLDNSSKLLENVLLWSRSQAGMLNFKPVSLDIFDVVQSSVDILKSVATHKQIEVANLVEKGIRISADIDMMNTIFRNLLSNAIKFTAHNGKVEVCSHVKTDDSSGKESIHISVIDYGIGMNAKTLKDLFRVDKKNMTPGTNNETGTGLGLVLCKDFIEKHSGTIIVESIENVGSRFIITLPGRH